MRQPGLSLVVAALALAMAGAPTAAGADTNPLEYAVKAAYLYKFAPFVEWPAAAFASPSSPFQLCILGRDPFGAQLDHDVAGQRVNDHPVQVRRLDRPDAVGGCQILYLGSTHEAVAAEALRAVRGAPVLTVADQGEGAIIRFVVQNNRVRFAIDAAAAATNRVTISSKLLSLALPLRAGA